MSWQASKWAMWVAEPRSYQEKVVLCALAEVSDSDGKDAYPSKHTIAEGVGINDVRQVRRVIHQLERDGLIRKGDQSKAAGLPIDKRPVVYDLPIDKTREELRALGWGKHNPDKDVPVEGSTFDIPEHDDGAIPAQDGVNITPDTTTECTTGGVEITPPSKMEQSGGVLSTPPGGYSVPPKPSINHPIDSGALDLTGTSDAGAENTPPPEQATQPHHGEENQAVTVEVDSRRRGWMPSQTAMATAKDVIKLTDIMLHITRYRVVKAERKQRCSSSEWLRWIIQDEQKAQLQERQDSMSRKKERRWYEDVAQ